jgi:hypothetical protein
VGCDGLRYIQTAAALQAQTESQIHIFVVADKILVIPLDSQVSLAIIQGRGCTGAENFIGLLVYQLCWQVVITRPG